MTEDKLRKLARKRAKAKIGFYIHLVVYVVVNAFLFLLWYFMTPDITGIPWFIYPLVGWGIGLVAHGLYTFYGGSGGTGWEDSMTERELEKLKAKESN